MNVQSLEIPDIKLITPKVHGDKRGFFSETYNKRDLSEHGIDLDFVQDNHAFSADKGTVRGLHFQTPPFAQDKLVRVTRGAVLDVAVDIRRNSPTFGQHVAVELSAEDRVQLLVPIGFAHAYCTLLDNTDIIYKVSNYYSKDHDFGLLWNDPELGIEWPVANEDVVLSEKDRQQPRLADLGDYFP